MVAVVVVVQIDDIKFRPPIFKVEIMICKYGDFSLEKSDFSLYFQGKLENRGSKLNVISRY